MANNSSIEWTEATWNPVVGCTIISPGCTNCYAMRMARRLEAMGQPKYAGTTRMSGGRPKWNGVVRIDEEVTGTPCDVEDRQDDLRQFDVGSFSRERAAGFHQACVQDHDGDAAAPYQILTKRAERLEEFSARLKWPKNVWMGVSVENEDYASRIDHLRRTGARSNS